MEKVIVKAFGGVDQMEVVTCDTPVPRGNEVLVRLTSVGMNYAELMSRRGAYKLASGDPPFTPGLEGGGIIEAIGESVTRWRVGDRVILGVDAPRRATGGGGGTYRTHYLTTADKVVAAPHGLADELLGAVWLPYLTAWGCLVWQQRMKRGDVVLLPAASSSVAIAAAQIVKDQGGRAIGTTTSPDKVERLRTMPEAVYDDVIVTRDRPWWQDVKRATDGHGCDVIFDPVAAGDFLSSEIRLLAKGGTIWIYGLLGETGPVEVTPLIRLQGAIRGWALTQLAEHGGEPLAEGYRYILERLDDGRFQLPLGGTYRLSDVREAHTAMERGEHIGKLVLLPTQAIND